jgi:hypothetical protein
VGVKGGVEGWRRTEGAAYLMAARKQTQRQEGARVPTSPSTAPYTSNQASNTGVFGGHLSKPQHKLCDTYEYNETVILLKQKEK